MYDTLPLEDKLRRDFLEILSDWLRSKLNEELAEELLEWLCWSSGEEWTFVVWYDGEEEFGFGDAWMFWLIMLVGDVKVVGDAAIANTINLISCFKRFLWPKDFSETRHFIVQTQDMQHDLQCCQL